MKNEHLKETKEKCLCFLSWAEAEENWERKQRHVYHLGTWQLKVYFRVSLCLAT
jgi:hypothetical protein